jgi:hypothetical protein
MADESTYPNIPRRPNFTDIRTMQIFDPAVIGNSTTTASWVQLDTTGATLENGVRIKNTDAANIALISVTGLTAEGFWLTGGEEVFLEVRQLSNVYIKNQSGASALTFIAS